MNYDYAEEIKAHFRSSFYRIAFPVLLPFYLLLNFMDWILHPDHGFEFLMVRLTILPVVLFCFTAIRRSWSGPWHFYTVWICAFAGALQLTYMAYRSGTAITPLYLYSINMVAGCLLFIFPMSLRGNLITLGTSFFAPVAAMLLRVWQGGLDRPSFSSVIFYFAMGTILAVVATEVDRLRYRTFQQKVNLFFLATTDVLSGLKLRRYFFNRFIQELSLRFRTGRDVVLSVAVLDIDGFKAFNDRYGHQAGDQGIKHLGEIIRSTIRVYDIACRFGGEEFIILFPETNLEQVQSVCERLRKNIQQRPVQIGNQEVPLTVSIGVSGIDTPLTESLKAAAMDKNQRLVLIKHMVQMIRLADEALYEAKKRGRNCIFLRRQESFETEVAEDEVLRLKDYLSYFEQPLPFFEPAESVPLAARLSEEINFYSEEYFFRRCVEGLYRWYRDPEWSEVLAVIRVRGGDPKAMRAELGKMFRLSDTLCVIGSGAYGIIFFGMDRNCLPQVFERINKRLLASAPGSKISVTLAAAALEFPKPKQVQASSNYKDFSRYVTELLHALKHHRFVQGEEFYFHNLKEEKPAKLKAAG